MDIARRALILTLAVLPVSAKTADGYRAFTDDDSVVSLTVTPGRQPSMTRPPRPGVPPMFVVGLDPASGAWLRRHRQVLRDRGAIGFVLGKLDAGKLHALRQWAGTSKVFPLASDELLRAQGIAHVPVLIDLAVGRIVQ